MEEHNGVHSNHGVVLGDDFLPRNVEDLLHDIDLPADTVKERDDDGQAGLGRIRISTKAFNGVDKTLLNYRHTHHHKDDNDQGKQAEKIFHKSPPV